MCIHALETGPGAHPDSCTMRTGSLPGVKWPGRCVNHPLPSSAEVTERAEPYLYSPSVPLPSMNSVGSSLPTVR